jgi:hypothetical protein
MAKIITHRPVHVPLPRELYFAVMREAERANCSMGSLLLSLIPPERLEAIALRLPMGRDEDETALSA